MPCCLLRESLTALRVNTASLCACAQNGAGCRRHNSTERRKGMSCPSWQWHGTGSCWSPVQTSAPGLQTAMAGGGAPVLRGNKEP